MDYYRNDFGLVIYGDAFGQIEKQHVDAEFGTGEDCIPKFPLIICDPPYGNIVDEDWDKTTDYWKWFEHCAEVAADHATIAFWGGIGKQNNRPFLEFAANIESRYPAWEIKNWITWSKKRAYGVQDNYLFTREECLILIRGTPTFNIPLLDTKRGYAGYNPEYPAKSEFYRRTNVWTDITELFRGKIHPCQKPDRLYEVLIETHTNEGDSVYDPCAGSLTTKRACAKTSRRFCVIEKKMEYLIKAGLEFSCPTT